MKHITAYLSGWVWCSACKARHYAHWPNVANCDALECPTCGSETAVLCGPAHVTPAAEDPNYIESYLNDVLYTAQRRRACS